MLLAVLLGCQRPEPAPLPPPRREQWRPRGRTVAASDGLHGYLVKPETLPAQGVLMLVDTLDDDSRSQADQLAREGSVALAIIADTPTERAQAYLDRLADTRGTRVRCLRTEGC